MEKQYYITKDQYETIKKTWAAAENGHKAGWHIFYNILRSKPADLGFTVRKSHIQCNDPWWGFNYALQHAWAWTRPNEITKENFKRTFGIDMPEDFREKLLEIGLKK